jgi:hypothetical protein
MLNVVKYRVNIIALCSLGGLEEHDGPVVQIKE